MKTFDSKELTPGEFFDRFTIIIRKAKFDPSNYTEQINEFSDIISMKHFSGELLKLICQLQMINTDIWNLESDLRKGKEGELGLAEVGRRALHIRNINAERIDCINKINKIFGLQTKETKFNHASE